MTRKSGVPGLKRAAGIGIGILAWTCVASGCGGVDEPAGDSDDTAASADLEFRPVLLVSNPGLTDEADVAQQEWPPSAPALESTDPSSLDWITKDLAQTFVALDCSDPSPSATDPAAGQVACSQDGSEKFVLGPVELDDGAIASATAEAEPTQTGAEPERYAVFMELTPEGASMFAEATARFASLDAPRNRFAMVLDGIVISAPAVQGEIVGGEIQLTGGFTEDEARLLATNLLKER